MRYRKPKKPINHLIATYEKWSHKTQKPSYYAFDIQRNTRPTFILYTNSYNMLYAHSTYGHI